jgi:hypothetical protein
MPTRPDLDENVDRPVRSTATRRSALLATGGLLTAVTGCLSDDGSPGTLTEPDPATEPVDTSTPTATDTETPTDTPTETPTPRPPALSAEAVGLDALPRPQLPVRETDGGVQETPSFSLPEDERSAAGSGGPPPATASADVFLGRDPDAFHLRCVVEDETHVTVAGEQMWQGDNVQLGFGHDGRFGPTFGITHGEDGAELWQWVEGPTEEDETAVEATTSREGTTTTYDVSIPWTALFGEAPGPGETFPFGFTLNDSDGDERLMTEWRWRPRSNSGLGAVALVSADVPWVASLDGPGFVSTGDRNAWTAAIANYGDVTRSFRVTVPETDLSTTVEVPREGAALAAFERTFTEGSGDPRIALTVTDEASGHTRDLEMSVRA